jgi:hypothetical protein
MQSKVTGHNYSTVSYSATHATLPLRDAMAELFDLKEVRPVF